MNNTPNNIHVPGIESMLQELVYRPVDQLKPYKGNARRHNTRQITALAAAYKKFGFRGAVLINEEDTILAGHGRVDAAKLAEFTTIPAILVKGLSKAEEKAFVLSDNRLSELSEWDDDLLKIELDMLVQEDFAVETTGFSTAEIDLILDDTPKHKADDPDDLKPEDVTEVVVSSEGDIWILGKHRLVCGSALEQGPYIDVMEDKPAQMCITDPPYNVPIDKNVCGTGSIKHNEFVMASGEMDAEEFTGFLKTALTRTAEFMDDGAIAFVCMDWRHQRELLDAAQPVFGAPRQMCVWVKDNGGMGSFYRSQHELVYVFKNGTAKHINNFELGQHGRYRTNVWSYPGVNSFGSGHELLKLHPTVKPASMIADAIRDCSKRGGLVLDPFAGSGTILVAAERTGRCARAIELDPRYVDVAIRRWQRVTGKDAIHAASGMTYTEMLTMKTSGKD